MRANTLIALLVLLLVSGEARTEPSRGYVPDVFWFDKYGELSWEDEKSRLDNFVIQLFNQPNYVGYIYVQVGRRSCPGQAVAHALKARQYLLEVRHLPWERLGFRDLGYGDSFEVTLWTFPAGKPPLYVPEYRASAAEHLVETCTSGRMKRRRRKGVGAINQHAHNKALQLTAR